MVPTETSLCTLSPANDLKRDSSSSRYLGNLTLGEVNASEVKEREKRSLCGSFWTNLEQWELGGTDVSTQQKPEQIAPLEPCLLYKTLKKVELHDQVLYGRKPLEEEPGETNAEAEVQSIVSVPIHQDTSSVPPMTTPVIDLTKRKLAKEKIETVNTRILLVSSSQQPPPTSAKQAVSGAHSWVSGSKNYLVRLFDAHEDPFLLSQRTIGLLRWFQLLKPLLRTSLLANTRTDDLFMKFRYALFTRMSFTLIPDGGCHKMLIKSGLWTNRKEAKYLRYGQQGIDSPAISIFKLKAVRADFKTTRLLMKRDFKENLYPPMTLKTMESASFCLSVLKIFITRHWKLHRRSGTSLPNQDGIATRSYDNSSLIIPSLVVLEQYVLPGSTK
ncbi:hypothetical protein Tco_1247368 [Tanacetum coccineum]